MAYDPKVIYDKAMKAIKDKKLFFIEDVVAFLPCTKSTFYELFPLESNEMNDIKREIEENKVVVKVSIRSKLLKGKGMELIALYKILATPSELASLQNRVDHTTNGQDMPGVTNIIHLGDGTKPEEEK